MKLIDSKLLTWLSAQAAANPRLRQNFNIHDSNDEACQRLLNAVEPGSYIRPHRHLTFAKPESFVGLRGRIALLILGIAGVRLTFLLFARSSRVQRDAVIYLSIEKTGTPQQARDWRVCCGVTNLILCRSMQ